MAAAGRVTVGRPGQRVDVAADPGDPGAAGVHRLAAALADTGGAGDGAGRGGDPCLGPAGLPAPGAAAARRGNNDRGAARRRGPRRPRGAAGSARRRRIHRRGGRLVRVRATACGGRHQCPPGAGPGAAGVAPCPARHRPRPTSSWPSRYCPRTRRPRPAGASPRWSSAPWSARRASPRCTVPARSAAAVPGAWPADPAYDGPPRRGQTYDGTDRQARGRLLAVLRAATGPVTRQQLDRVWPDAVQRVRALDGLVTDGLVEPLSRHRYRLPGCARPESAPTGD